MIMVIMMMTIMLVVIVSCYPLYSVRIHIYEETVYYQSSNYSKTYGRYFQRSSSAESYRLQQTLSLSSLTNSRRIFTMNPYRQQYSSLSSSYHQDISPYPKTNIGLSNRYTPSHYTTSGYSSSSYGTLPRYNRAQTPNYINRDRNFTSNREYKSMSRFSTDRERSEPDDNSNQRFEKYYNRYVKDENVQNNHSTNDTKYSDQMLESINDHLMDNLDAKVTSFFKMIIPVEMLINVKEIEMEKNEVPKKYREITYTEEVDLQQNAEEALKLSLEIRFAASGRDKRKVTSENDKKAKSRRKESKKIWISELQDIDKIYRTSELRDIINSVRI
ncbi:hypothetical protein ACO02O_08818 [Dirofilaria immitis]